MVGEPRFRQESDEYLYAFDEDGVGVKFYQLRQVSPGRINGYIEVYALRPDAPPGSHWWNHVNLTTQVDRTRTQEKLKRLAPRNGDPKAWEYEVDQVYADCAKRLMSVPEPQDLLDGEPEQELEHLFNPIALLNQVNMFVADQGSTKSFLLLYLAVCIVSGRVGIFGKPRTTGPVVIFDWEVDRAVQRRRVGWICRALGMPEPRGIFYENMSDRGSIMDNERNMRLQLVRTGAVATIIDSLTFGAGGDLNATEISAPTMKVIGGLGAGVTKLITAHPPKSSRARPRSNGDNDGQEHGGQMSIIGSGLWEFRPRSIWTMRAPARHNRGNSFVVTMTDHKGSDSGHAGEVFYRLSFDPLKKAAGFVRADAMDRAAQQDLEQPLTDKLLAFLAERPHQQDNTVNIRKALGATANAVRQAAWRLKREGRIEKIGGSDEGHSETAVWKLLPTDGSSALETAPETHELPF